ncbi:MAG: hypothetical protein Q7S20_01320 [Gemmatimonadaceae bacterium]|nr:hypothetical protein [Gemmatimonadaceae bacterium]
MSLASLVVHIGADTSGLNKALTQSQKDIQKAGRQFSNLGASLTKNLVIPIVGVGAALAASAVKVGTFADELLDLVDMTGLTARTLQEFRHVASVAGVESDTLANAAIKLTAAMSSGDEQGKKLGDALGLLGIKANDASGKLVSMDVLLPQIITGLQGMTDITSRNALAADIFGKSWSELAPILSMTSGEMTAARDEAQRLGLVMSDEALKSADAFRKALGTLTQTAGAITREIGVGMIPVMTSLAKFLQESVVPAVRAVVGWFGDLSTGTKITIGVVAGLAVALTGAVIIFGTILKFMPLLTSGFTALTGPIGLTILAIGALTAAGIQMVKHWDAVKLQFVLAWTAMKDAAFTSVGFILDMLVALTVRIPVLAGKIMGLRSAFDLIAEKSMASSGRAIGALELKLLDAGTAAEMTDSKVRKLVSTLNTLGSGGASKLLGRLAEQLGGLGTSVTPAFAGAGGSNPLSGPKIAEMTGNIVSPSAGGRPYGFQEGDSFGMKIGRVIQAGAGNSEMGQMIQATAEFGKFAILLPIISGAMETLAPAFSALLEPLKMVGRVIGDMLVPPIKMVADLLSAALAPALKILAGVVRVISVAFSFVSEAIGWMILGIGKLIDSLPFVSAKGMINMGQSMIDAARAARRNTDATDDATDAVTKFASALSNIPRVLNINALRHMVTGAGGGDSGSGGGGSVGGSGGGGGGGKGDQILYSYDTINITVPGAGDPERVAEAVGRVIERKRARGGMSRLALAVAT